MTYVKPWHGEDYGEAWGFLDFKNKVVLDVGADYGSTAVFFLEQGAKRVIGVECRKKDYRRMEALSKILPLVPVYMRISSAADYKQLIDQFNVDLMKIDCEGCEAYLLDLDDDWFAKVPEYAIELHNQANSIQCGNPHNYGNDLRKPFVQKFTRCGFAFDVLKPFDKWLIWARKEIG